LASDIWAYWSELDSNAVKRCPGLHAKVKEYSEYFLLEFDSPIDAFVFALHSTWNFFPNHKHNEIRYTDYHMQNRFLVGIEHLGNYVPCPPRRYLFLVKPEYGRESEMEVRRLYSAGLQYLTPELFRQTVEMLEKELPKALMEAVVRKPKAWVPIIQRTAKEEGLSEEEYSICYTGPGERLYNLLAGFVLKEDGWMIFPEGTLSSLLPVGGAPDMIAVKIPDLQEYLVSLGIVEKRGFWLAELQAKSSNTKIMLKDTPDEGLSIVLEGESSNRSVSKGRSQLNMYMDSKLFNGGVLVGPEIIEAQAAPHGVISWNRDGVLLKRYPRMQSEKSTLETLSVTSKLVAATLRHLM
jgi:hypothetical protein